MKKFADIVVPLPTGAGPFTYSVPEHLLGAVVPGVRALVPFGKRMVTGFVLALTDKTAVKKVKAIADVLDEVPVFDGKRLKFYKWMASYYVSSLGEVLSLTTPSSVNVKSVRRFRITDKGRALLEKSPLLDGTSRPTRPGLSSEILGAALKPVTLSTLLNRFKGRSVYSALGRLKKDGLIEEEVSLKGRRAALTERVVAPAEGIEIGEAAASTSLKRSLVQKRVLEHLVSHGELSVSELRTALPGSSIDAPLKALSGKGLVTIKERQVAADPMDALRERPSAFRPTPEQASAITEIVTSLGTGFAPFLLYGITGSGKTLVYLRAIEEAIKKGKRALVLVPEIGLTGRLASYLKGAFPGSVALMHSSLSTSERYAQWRSVLTGEASVVIGARSALFSPIKDLGLIVVDEEHDPSYKQEDGVRYNARDSALMLGKTLGATVVLGSATPSIETFYNSRNGKLKPLYLKGRIQGASLPEVEILDMRGDIRGTGETKGTAEMKSGDDGKEGGRGGSKGRVAADAKGKTRDPKDYPKEFKRRRRPVLSERLTALMEETLADGEQTLLFLNRRGYSGCIVCTDCGLVIACPNCSVSLTFHKSCRRLRCHYCDLSMTIPEACPSCRGPNLHDPGLGTERVEEEVRQSFPRARVARLDRDTARKKGATDKILSAVEDRSVDCLVGTQMVSKGHHFPGIRLVGVVSGDTSLNIPDFRGSERSFQLISQAAGRAGRADSEGGEGKGNGKCTGSGSATSGKPARVLIQTLNPGHFCFAAAAAHDYETFFTEELKARKEALYPPFVRLALIRLEGTKEGAVLEAARRLKADSDGAAKARGPVTVLGPAPALIARLRGRYRFQLLVKAKSPGTLTSFLNSLKAGFQRRGGRAVTLTIDVDPSVTV